MLNFGFFQLIFGILIVFLVNDAHANGLGKIQCGGSSFLKKSFFESPAQKTDCTYTIKAYSFFVCQLRVDFDVNLAGLSLSADDDGTSFMECRDDFLEIGEFKFCGSDKGQHIYLPFNRTAGQKEIPIRIVLADRTRRRSLPTPKWNVRVTQLECSLGSPLRSFPMVSQLFKSIVPRTFFSDGFLIAPVGCQQYYPDDKGVIKSFNYNGGNSYYPGGRDYTICIRRTAATSALQLVVDHFRMPPYLEGQFDIACRSQIAMPVGVNDYLAIPEAQISGTGVRASLFCGILPSSTVIESKTTGPFVLQFHSDPRHDDDDGTVKTRGFSLRYSIL